MLGTERLDVPVRDRSSNFWTSPIYPTSTFLVVVLVRNQGWTREARVLRARLTFRCCWSECTRSLSRFFRVQLKFRRFFFPASFLKLASGLERLISGRLHAGTCNVISNGLISFWLQSLTDLPGAAHYSPEKMIETAWRGHSLPLVLLSGSCSFAAYYHVE